uniref:Putative glycosyltransferase n=1 Tax=viral metagenome TaxID=1070528 RepID=A0A6M3J8S1_9ZZZZ
MDYNLDVRIDRSSRWLYYNWRRAKKTNPTITKPNHADVFYQAGVGALERALRHDVDCVLVVSAMFLHPDVIMLMKRAGLRVAILFTESPYDQAKELEVAPMVDGCWTNERTSVEAFRAVNPNAGYLPHAWHPARHMAGVQLNDAKVRAHDVVFVGSGFQDRIEWLNAIDWTGIDLGLYGSWEAITKRHRLHRYLAGDVVDNLTTAALYRRAKIGLNLYRTSKGWGRHAERIAPNEAESLNPRAYELARCGAFHLSTARKEVTDVFGDLVPTFTSAFEASALIRRWLADPEGRARIAAQLPACVAESSWIVRAKTVIGDLHTLLQSRAA